MCVGASKEDMEKEAMVQQLGGDRRLAAVFRFIHSFCEDGMATESNFQMICHIAHTMLTSVLIQAHQNPQNLKNNFSGKHKSAIFDDDDKQSGESSSSSSYTCDNCGADDADKKCARCKQTYYCNRDCQVSHWKIHKVDCH